MANFDDLLNNAAPTDPQDGQPFSKEEYAARKQAERAAVYELSDRTALEAAGDGGRFQQYLDVQTQFNRYSAVNALLILAQKPEATRIGDFDHWKNQGASVKPGQTGISILEPGKEYEREDGSIGISYNVKKVFDISQVDARKVKSPSAPKFTERQILSALISKAPVKITGVDKLPGDGGAQTDPQTGEIQVLKGMAFADTFRSVTHELCYAEAVRNDGDNIHDHQFTAYCASYILCKKYGVDTKDYTFDSEGLRYMLGDSDAQTVKGALSQIRDAADAITGRMVRQLDATAKAARTQEAR
jgi:hypothetical protein